MDIQAINIFTHIISGGLLLVLGLIPMVAVKGSASHKRFGRGYVVIYWVVLFTAVIGVLFFRSPPALMATTLVAFYGFVSGVRALKIKACGPQLLDNLISVMAIAVSLSMLVVMSKNASGAWSPTMGYSVLGFMVTYALYDLSRNCWRKLWMNKLWAIDHGFKLVGSYFALASAASGNLLRDFQPWSAITPTIVGTIVSFLLIYLFIRKSKRGVIAV